MAGSLIKTGRGRPEKREARRAVEGVRLFVEPDLEDPIQKEALKLVPIEMREYISQIFVDGRFVVRKDMINNAVGYREASVADAWSGLSRFEQMRRLPPREEPCSRDTTLGNRSSAHQRGSSSRLLDRVAQHH